MLLCGVDFVLYLNAMGAYHGTVGWGITLQAGRLWVWFPMVSSEFFIKPIVQLRYGPRFLTKMLTKGVSWGVEVASAWGWQPYHFHMPIVLNSGRPNLLESLGPVHACTGIPLPVPLLVWCIKQQFVITHTICQTDIPASLHFWVTNAPSVRMLC